MASGDSAPWRWGVVPGWSHALLAFALLALAAALLSGPVTPRAPEDRAAPLRIAASPPLSFVPNRGQTDERVRYHAQGPGFGFYFTRRNIVLSFTRGSRGVALQLRPLAANPRVRVEARHPGPGTVNYLVGGKRDSNLPTYEEIAYRQLWPGIDMVFRGQPERLKYEFRLRPGADPSRIRLAYAGSEGLSVGAGGALVVDTALGGLRDSRPRSFQRIDGRRVPVASRYKLGNRSGTYGFTVGAHDSHRPLVIDPGLSYSTYLGGTATDRGFASNDSGGAIAVDGSGSAYVTGTTDSADFPTTPGAFDTSPGGGDSDAFVTKLDPTGSSVLFSTYLGGSDLDEGRGIAVDASGNAYVTGVTLSTNFPTTAGVFNPGPGRLRDAFVTKLDATGSSLLYSSYVGGSSTDEGRAIAVDGSGSAYITGQTHSSDFPTTPGAFDTQANAEDAFVTKLDPSGSALLFSTYLGGSVFGGPFFGSAFDEGRAIVVDGSGSAYVAGETFSTDFPTTAGAFDTSQGGGGFGDGFASKLDPSGSSLVFSTYLGGSNADSASGIAVDPSGNAYVTGKSFSTDFPTTAGAFDPSLDGADAFVTKLAASGSNLVFSTYLGGESRFDEGRSIAVDGSGSAYVTGITDSTGFPTTADAFDTTLSGVTDAFVTKLAASGSSLLFSTYLGGAASDEGHGIAVDASEGVYLTGATSSADFPTTTGAFDTSLGGGFDAFATKLSFAARTAGCSVINNGRITTAGGDTATFHGNVKGAPPRGREDYTDHGPATPIRVHSLAVDSITCSSDRKQATVLGKATIDGAGSFDFRIDVTDLGWPGRRDTYRIRLSDGYDSGVGRLTRGNIQIRKGRRI